VALKSFIIEVTGKEAKVNALADLLRPYGLLEMVRTGEVAIFRGKRVEEEEEKHVRVEAGTAGPIGPLIADDGGRSGRGTKHQFKDLREVRGMAKIYYEQDCDLNVLKGKTIAIIGFGNQGENQALTEGLGAQRGSSARSCRPPSSGPRRPVFRGL
jgi:hypothetical protein